MRGGLGPKQKIKIDEKLNASSENPLENKRITEVFNLLAPAPNYTQPNANLSSNKNGYFERGTTIIVSLSTQFSKNDAGNATMFTLFKNGNKLKENENAFNQSDKIVLTNNVNYQLQVSYAEGITKDNPKLGFPDNRGQIPAGTKTDNVSIRPVIPQWRGQKADNNSMDNSSYSSINAVLNRFVSRNNNTSITVSAGNYGFFISTNNNAKIIEDGTGFEIAKSAFTKNEITVKLSNGDDVSLTEYIINPSGGEFKYNLR